MKEILFQIFFVYHQINFFCFFKRKTKKKKEGKKKKGRKKKEEEKEKKRRSSSSSIIHQAVISENSDWANSGILQTVNDKLNGINITLLLRRNPCWFQLQLGVQVTYSTGQFTLVQILYGSKEKNPTHFLNWCISVVLRITLQKKNFRFH